VSDAPEPRPPHDLSCPPPVERLETEPVPSADRRVAEQAERAESRLASDASARRRAWTIAIVADVLQWALFPFFLGGGAAPWDVALDLFVAFAMVRLMGFHVAFLPAFVAELIPIANFVPSWTLAMLIVTRMRGKPQRG
jgi:hypothetical protein